MLLIHFCLIACAVLYNFLFFKGATTASLVFDSYIFFVFLFSVFSFKLRFSLKLFVFSLSVLFYIIVTVYLFFLRAPDFGFVEVLRSIRPLYYLVIFALMISYMELNAKRKSFTFEFRKYKVFVGTLSFIFLITYLVQAIILNVERPRLYSENNYEIPSLLILLVGLSIYSKKLLALDSYGEKKTTIVITLVTFLSLSKSAVLELVALFLGKLVEIKSSLPQLLISVVGCLIITYFAYDIIASRLSRLDTIESLDRFRFLLFFLSDFSRGGALELFFGYGVASELPSSTCSALSYYIPKLFSSPGYCNSIIYHSLILRVIYDFGIFGSFIYLGSWFILLNLAFDRHIALSIYIILFLASVSISGFANPIVIWPLFTLLLIRKSDV